MNVYNNIYNNVYNREQFKDAMAAIKDTYDFVDGLELAARRSDGCYIDWFAPDCSLELCKALEAMFGDEYETIQWFCYEIDFGKDYDGGNLLNGKEYPLSTVDELYDYLIAVSQKGRDDQ